MTVEGPRLALVSGQAADQSERDRWLAASYRCPCGFAADDMGERAAAESMTRALFGG